MRRIAILLLTLLSFSTYAQDGVNWNKYFIKGSLAVGKGKYNKADSASYAKNCAWLEIGGDTTTRGIIIPRVLDVANITGPVRGLIAYDLTDNSIMYYDGTDWAAIGTGGGSVGNAGYGLGKTGSTFYVDTTKIVNINYLQAQDFASETFVNNAIAALNLGQYATDSRLDSVADTKLDYEHPIYRSNAILSTATLYGITGDTLLREIGNITYWGDTLVHSVTLEFDNTARVRVYINYGDGWHIHSQLAYVAEDPYIYRITGTSIDRMIVEHEGGTLEFRNCMMYQRNGTTWDTLGRVIDIGAPGTWNGNDVSSHTVLNEIVADTVYGYYEGRGTNVTGGAIGLMGSVDSGRTFFKIGTEPIIAGTDYWGTDATIVWSTHMVCDDIKKIDGRYFMTVHAFHDVHPGWHRAVLVADHPRGPWLNYMDGHINTPGNNNNDIMFYGDGFVFYDTETKNVVTGRPYVRDGHHAETQYWFQGTGDNTIKTTKDSVYLLSTDNVHGVLFDVKNMTIQPNNETQNHSMYYKTRRSTDGVMDTVMAMHPNKIVQVGAGTMPPTSSLITSPSLQTYRNLLMDNRGGTTTDVETFVNGVYTTTWRFRSSGNLFEWINRITSGSAQYPFTIAASTGYIHIGSNTASTERLSVNGNIIASAPTYNSGAYQFLLRNTSGRFEGVDSIPYLRVSGRPNLGLYTLRTELADSANTLRTWAIGQFAGASHNHDTRYYTKTEVNSLFAGYTNTTDLNNLLAGKADTCAVLDTMYFTGTTTKTLHLVFKCADTFRAAFTDATGGGAGVDELAELVDVDLTGLADGDMLRFNLSTGKWEVVTLATVAFTGDYDDLSNKPTLFSGDYDDLTDKPSLFDGAYSSLTGVPSTFPPSTHSHDYDDDITDKPILRGTGSPEGAVTATVGTIYQRTNGGAGTVLYLKESGSGNTGWVAYGASGAETDPVFSASDAFDIATSDIDNWNDAFGWGDHAGAGYLVAADIEDAINNGQTAKAPSQNAVFDGLATKEATITATTSADYYRGDKTFQPLNKAAVGLGNVDNTSDANKPISTATQAALDLKVDSVYRKNGTDSVFIIKDGVSLFAFRDSIGAGGATTSIYNITRMWAAVPGSTTASVVGWPATTTTGTVAAGSLATTNLTTQAVRVTYTSATSSNASAEICGTATILNLGDMKWRYTCIFSLPTYDNAQRMAIGLNTNTGTLNGASNISTFGTSVILGKDAGDNGLQWITRNGTTPTKTALSLVPSTTAMYKLTITWTKTQIEFKLTETTTSGSTDYTLNTSSTLPASSSFMTPHNMVGAAATGVAVAVAVDAQTIETEF